MADGVIDTLYIDVKLNSGDAEKGLNSLNQTLSRLSNITGSAGKQSTAFTSRLGSITSGSARLGNTLKKVYNIAGSWFKKNNEYVESLNLFRVSMGGAADSALEYARQVQNVMGINIQEWVNGQGAFNQIAEGFGIGSESANLMSKNLTQLAYDLSSLWNVDVSSAFTKLESGMSGQIKGLKAWGINISVAQLRETALAHGIELSTAKMTEAQKATLRYITIMEQSKNAQGDLARTIATPANAMRILQAQTEQAKIALGQVVSVVAVKVIPWFQALVQIIKDAAESLAGFLGYELPEIDYSSSLDLGADSATNFDDALGDAKDSAEKLKNSLVGMDELNKLGDATAGASAYGGGYDPTFGIDLSQYDYDFLSNVQMPDLEPFKQKLSTILKIATRIGAVILGWKVSTGLISTIDTLRKLLAVPSYAIIIGATLTITGFSLAFDGMGDAIENGLGGFNFTEILFGDLLGVGGAALLGGKIASWISTAFAGSKVATALSTAATNLGLGSAGAAGAALTAGVAAIILGVPTMITGIYDAIVAGLDWLNATLIGAGATLTGAGIGAIIGACGGPIGAGIGALIGLAVGLLTDLVILVVQNWDAVCSWCSNALSAVGQFFVNIWNGIVAVWNTVANWFNTYVIQPIASFFSGLWNGIVNLATSCWNGIVAVFSPVVEWFGQLFGSIWQTVSDIFYNIGVIANGCWEILKRVWSIAAEWFSTYVIQPVSNFFTGLWDGIKNVAISAWNGIKSVFSTVANWFDTWLIQPVSKFFNGLWDGFVKGAKAAWNGVKNVFSTVAEFFGNIFSKAWAGIVKVFSIAGDIFKDIKDAVVGAFVKVVNGIIKGINSVIALPFKGINGVLGWLKDLDILGIQPFSGIKTISIPQIPLIPYKDGGFPSVGEIFVANEAGPEMVGTIGNRTAVANTDQIITGISEGVSDANAEQNALLREQNALLRKLLEKDTVVNNVIGTNDIINGLQRKNRRDGKTVVPVSG